MARPRVLLLGTGGAANECRYQACLLIQRADPSVSPILLDTGNGLDVVRAMLAAGVDPVCVQDVFVSHRHADHAGGLDPLLLWRRVQMVRSGRPIEDAATRVYADARVVEAMGRVFDATASTTIEAFGGALAWRLLEDGQAVDLPSGGTLTPFLVDHAPVDGGALGCVVDVDGVRIAYSGDTRPCGRLVEAVRGADVLFHEAGGLDENADAVHRMAHSTAGDAGRAARVAGVGRLYLTHLPDDTLTDALLAEASAAFGGSVGLATDMGIVEL
ncbi:MAG: MBL fold metallo-hydrolase [Chloroflexota bacterium]